MAAINNGSQQVSIFPYQELDSALGNTILHGIVEPGVYSSTLRIEDAVSNVKFIIASGTTLVFFRSADSVNFVGKIVLTADAEVLMSKTALWSTYAGASKLYIVADWTYDKTQPSDKYVGFSVVPDTSELDVPYDLNIPGHKLLVGTFLNHSYLVGHQTDPLSNYHISYDNQTNRNLLKPQEYKNNEFQIVYASNGEGIRITKGNTFISGSLYNTSTTSVLIAPAPFINNTIPNKINGSIVDVTNPDTRSSYYQIDFLSIKLDENTGSFPVPTWDSFLQPIGSLDFDYYNITKENIREYLALYQFPIIGDGLILMAVIRDRAGAVNTLWPENSLIFNEGEEPLILIGSPKYHNRLKVPVWSSSDIYV